MHAIDCTKLLMCGMHAVLINRKIKKGNREKDFKKDKCTGKWTWSSKDKKSTIDYMVVSKEDEHQVTKMTVDDEGQMDVGSDHCVLKLEVDMGRPKLSKQEDVRWKWKVDGKEDWSEYQAAVTEHTEGWENWVKEVTASRTDHGEIVEIVWEEWKRRVTSAAERGIRLMKVVPGRAKSWWDNEIRGSN